MIKLKKGVSSAVITGVSTINLIGGAGGATVSQTTKGDSFMNANESLGGVTATAVWDGLSSADHSGFPGFPGAAPWPNAMVPNRTEGVVASSQLNKVGGNAYPAADSIYGGGTSGNANSYGATIEVNFDPILDVNSIVLQVQIGAAFGYDFVDAEMPVLLVNGSEIAPLVSEITDQVENGFYLGLPVYVNTYGVQWDLSGFEDPIVELAASFDIVQHSQLYGVRVDQSDAEVHQTVLSIPEPSVSLIGVLAFTQLLCVRKREWN